MVDGHRAGQISADVASGMEVLTRCRNQPAPPHVIFEALTDPERDPIRPWLFLEDGEQAPVVITSDPPGLLVWSSLWPGRPDILIRFELPRDASGYGTDLRWTLEMDEPVPDPEELRRLRRRINLLVNGNLRDTFDQ
jgi:hypothetical protein